MNSYLARFMVHPYPMRYTLAKMLIQKFTWGSYVRRLQMGAVERPHYGYCLYNGACLAKKLGYERISVLEFGVAGGKGLVNLEYHAKHISALLSIAIEIYGFDIAEGLPKPLDYRDLPYNWEAGFFKMDVDRLRQNLTTAQLILGDVKETVGNFFSEYNPAPIAAVIYDLDFYSSTIAALKIFDADEKYWLPRAYCYFDDTVGGEIQLYSDYTGARLAINEFNQTHKTKKLALPYHLLAQTPGKPWHHSVFIYHDFLHDRYNDFIAKEDKQLPLFIKGGG